MFVRHWSSLLKVWTLYYKTKFIFTCVNFWDSVWMVYHSRRILISHVEVWFEVRCIHKFCWPTFVFWNCFWCLPEFIKWTWSPPLPWCVRGIHLQIRLGLLQNLKRKYGGGNQLHVLTSGKNRFEIQFHFQDDFRMFLLVCQFWPKTSSKLSFQMDRSFAILTFLLFFKTLKT